MPTVIEDPWTTELPREGTHRAVIIDVVEDDDDGMVPTPMLRVVYLLETENQNEHSFLVSQAFVKSLARTERFSQLLDCLGISERVGAIDVERLLVGLQVTLTIMHTTEGGTPRARVEAVELRQTTMAALLVST